MALIRVKQAADYLGLSKSFLDKARCYGGGPAFIRFGNAVVYSTDDLDKWAADHRVANDNATASRAA